MASDIESRQPATSSHEPIVDVQSELPSEWSAFSLGICPRSRRPRRWASFPVAPL